jgi:hypothetical protein
MKAVSRCRWSAALCIMISVLLLTRLGNCSAVCRSRQMKCDEKKPTCSASLKSKRQCVYATSTHVSLCYLILPLSLCVHPILRMINCDIYTDEHHLIECGGNQRGLQRNSSKPSHLTCCRSMISFRRSCSSYRLKYFQTTITWSVRNLSPGEPDSLPSLASE